MSAQTDILELFRTYPRHKRWLGYEVSKHIGVLTKEARSALDALVAEGRIATAMDNERVYFMPSGVAESVDDPHVAVPREVQLLRRPEMRGYEARLRAQMQMAMATRR